VRSCLVADAISLIMLGTPLSARDEWRDCRLKFTLLRVHWNGQRPRREQSFSIACEGTDRR
jgi:hypothetical protein